jgi:hypothetical protein
MAEALLSATTFAVVFEAAWAPALGDLEVVGGVVATELGKGFGDFKRGGFDHGSALGEALCKAVKRCADEALGFFSTVRETLAAISSAANLPGLPVDGSLMTDRLAAEAWGAKRRAVKEEDGL